MTPVEISEKYGDLKQDLQKLASVEIGMSNYREVMHKYQQLLYSSFGLGEEMCSLLDKALNPLATPVVESQKEIT